MSRTAAADKPQLQGVKIKARKRAVKASAKHEPEIFRDQLYKHLETVPEGDFDGFTKQLVQAGTSLEFLKYADALFEILLCGGLLQPGGSYVDDDAPMSPFTIINAKEPTEVADLKPYVEVFNKLIRRYKYLQRPLEDSSLPTLLQYVDRWPQTQMTKLAITVGLLQAQGLSTAACLLSLTKDHLVKNDVSVNVLAIIFRAYLSEQGMDHLSTTLRKGGVKDLLAFFPENKRDHKTLDEFFRKAGLPQVAEWWVKKQYAIGKETIVSALKEAIEREDSTASIIESVKAQQEELKLPETELVACIWQGLMATVDWSARPDQIEALALREVTKYCPVLEPFCNGAKTEVALINVVQVYCYEDTRIMKSFPNILKVLYNKDCVSDQAIIYWHQKGSKPQGRQHFLKSTETLVKFLQEQDEESEEE
jgi:hypothetical protein